MIKRIELVNFMSHEHTVIDLADGLTALVGPNNCGKSAVVTALQILSHNDPSKFVIRHGAREARVRVETDDGHVIQWSRTKNGSPRYLIDGEEFDRLNRGTPESLSKTLRLASVKCEQDEFDVHFGEQKAPVFLLNDPPRAAAQFFASSSDAVRLVEMQSLHKQKIRDSKLEHSRATLELGEIDKELKLLDPIDELLEQLDRCESINKKFEKEYAKIEHLNSMIGTVEQTAEAVVWKSAVCKVYRSLDAPPDIVPTENLSELIDQLELTQFECLRAGSDVEVLSALELPPEQDPESELNDLVLKMQQAIDQIETVTRNAAMLADLDVPPEMADETDLAEMVRELTREQQTVSKNELLASELRDEINQVYSEICDWVDAHPLCPTCRQRVSAKQLLQAGEHKHG